MGVKTTVMDIELFFVILGFIVTLIAMIGGLVTVWVNTKVKIATIDSKVLEIETRLDESMKSRKLELQKLYEENREDHQVIMAKNEVLIAHVAEIKVELKLKRG